MKHLYIKQNNNVEIVSLDIIEKLYQISQGGLDSTSDLIGNLQCTHAYNDAVTYLTTKFKNLQINVTDGSYIRFADKEVEKICATNWGDGIGITAAQAAAVSSVGTKFKGNTSIVSFNELEKFTNVRSLPMHAFNGCSSLVELKLSCKLSRIEVQTFFQCSSLEQSPDLSECTYVGSNAFAGCNKITSFNITNKCTYIDSAAFAVGASLLDAGDLSGVTYVGSYAYNGSKNIQSNIILTSITKLESAAFIGACTPILVIGPNITSIGWNGAPSATKYTKCLAVSPPTFGGGSFSKTTPIYVPDSSVDAYKSASNWSTYANIIFGLSQFDIDFPNG